MVLSPMGLGIAWDVLPSVSSVPADPSSCVTVMRRLGRAPSPAQGARPALSCSKGAQGTAEPSPPCPHAELCGDELGYHLPPTSSLSLTPLQEDTEELRKPLTPPRSPAQLRKGSLTAASSPHLAGGCRETQLPQCAPLWPPFPKLAMIDEACGYGVGFPAVGVQNAS